MPYKTERGVTSYSDHDTPSEYATGADEARAAYNEVQDAAFAAAEKLHELIDDLCDPPSEIITGTAVLLAMTMKLREFANDARKLMGHT